MKRTGIKLELLTDPDMLLMSERGIRGGITQAVCKYAWQIINDDIADDVPARFDTLGYCPSRPLPIALNKKVIGLMKDELRGAIMTEVVALRPRLYSYKN